jgi:hypothetical protein
VVVVNFRNHGEAKAVTYRLVHNKKGWAIYEITSGCNLLTTILKGESKC